MDLRELAIILNEGKKAARDIQDPGLEAALSAMTEVAVMLALESPLWNVEEDFKDLASGYL